MKNKQAKKLSVGQLVKIKGTRGKHRLWRYVITPAGVEGWMVMRGAVQAALWLNPPDYPYLVTESFDEAKTWGLSELERAKGGAA